MIVCLSIYQVFTCWPVFKNAVHVLLSKLLFLPGSVSVKTAHLLKRVFLAVLSIFQRRVFTTYFKWIIGNK